MTPAQPLVLMGASLALAIVWPIHVLPLPSFSNEWIAGMGALLCACYLFANKTLKVRWPRAVLFLVPLGLTVVYQTISGRYSYIAQPLFGLGFLAIAGVVSVVVSSVSAPDESARETCAFWFHFFIFLSAVITAATAFAQWFGWDAALQPFVFPMEAVAERGRPTGNIAQPNLLATICGMGMVSASWLSASGRSRSWPMGGLGLFLAAGVAISGSRMALLFIPLLVVIFASFLGARVDSRRCGRFWVVVPFAILLFHFLIPLAAPLIASPLISDELRALNFSSVSRLQLIEVAVAAVESNFLLGRGVGTYIEYMPYLAADHGLVGAGVAHHSHNLFLQMALDYGLPLTLMLVVGVTAYAYRSRWHSRRDLASLSAFGVLGVLLIHSQFEFPLWYLHFWIIFVWAATLLERRELCREAPFWGRYLLLASAAVLLFAGVHIYFDYSETRQRYRNVFEESPPALIAESDIRTYSLFRSQDEYIFHLLGSLNLPITNDDLLGRRRAVKRHPAAAALLRLAVVEQLAGNPQEAQKILETLRIVEPEYASVIKLHLEGACVAFQRPDICKLAESAL